MPFFERFLLLDRDAKPARVYLHTSGYPEAFGRPEKPDINAGREYASRTLRSNSDFFRNMDYLIVSLFGKSGKRVAEVFGHYDLANGNPTGAFWRFEDGLYTPVTPEDPEIGCGDTWKMLAAEEDWRRMSTDLFIYLSAAPPWNMMAWDKR